MAGIQAVLDGHPLEWSGDGSPGDYTVNLQWRLNNGEMPGPAPRVALLYIGSNDLSAADCNNTAEGVSVAAPGVVARFRTASHPP